MRQLRLYLRDLCFQDVGGGQPVARRPGGGNLHLVRSATLLGSAQLPGDAPVLGRRSAERGFGSVQRPYSALNLDAPPEPGALGTGKLAAPMLDIGLSAGERGLSVYLLGTHLPF